MSHGVPQRYRIILRYCVPAETAGRDDGLHGVCYGRKENARPAKVSRFRPCFANPNSPRRSRTTVALVPVVLRNAVAKPSCRRLRMLTRRKNLRVVGGGGCSAVRKFRSSARNALMEFSTVFRLFE